MNSWEYTIMIVADEPDEGLLFERAFQHAGVKNPIQVFCNAKEAIDHLGARRNSVGKPFAGSSPALMLLDLKTPRKTGFEVLEWVRRQPRLRRMVIVVMSDSLLREDINHAYDLGCNSYLSKPGNAEQLAEMVRVINNYWLILNAKPELGDNPNPFRRI